MAKIDFTGLVPDFIEGNEASWQNWLTLCVEERSFRVGRLVYHFVDDLQIQEINQSILDHDYPTDIITLDESRTDRLRVELWIGVDFIERSSMEYAVPLEAEFARVLVHGLLHCMGWNDKSIEDRDRMRAEEDKCLISRPK